MKDRLPGMPGPFAHAASVVLTLLLTLCLLLSAVSLTACTDDGEGQIDLPVESPENAASELIALREVIALLDDRDREMISLRYYRGMTQSRTAELLGMSQVQVSRREKAVLALLRRNLSA